MFRIFCWKNVSSFCKCKSYSHFLRKNISIYAIFNYQSFKDTLTNNIISCEQLGPVFLLKKAPYWELCSSFNRETIPLIRPLLGSTKDGLNSGNVTVFCFYTVIQAVHHLPLFLSFLASTLLSIFSLFLWDNTKWPIKGWCVIKILK